MAVQKTAPDYDPEKGCKWAIQQLRQYMTAKHGVEAVSENIVLERRGFILLFICSL